MKLFKEFKQGAISIVLIVIIAIVAVLAISGIGTYNGIVSADQNVKTQLGNIDSALKRRADLIPNLVNTVKGYVEHEDSAIEKVTSARQALLSATTIDEMNAANQELSSSLGRLIAIAENYPDLKASENFINLQYELAGTENRISTARDDYNNAVKAYNTKIKQFPGNIVAGFGGFSEAKYFEADEQDSLHHITEPDFCRLSFCQGLSRTI